MSRRDVLEAAGVGHRITHEDLPPPRGVTTRVVQMLGSRPRSSAGNLGPKIGRTFTVQSLGELEGEDPGEAPDPSGVIEVGSENTFIGRDRRPVALAAEDLAIPCENHSDGPILTGAKTVFVNGKPMARRSDETDCGAFVGEGEPTVLVTAETTEATERRPEPDIERRALGPQFGAMTTMSDESGAGVGVDIGRSLGGVRSIGTASRQTSALPSGTTRGVRVAQELTRHEPVQLLRTLTR